MTQGLAHTVDGVGVGSGTPHELFMEAAAVETLAVALASDGGATGRYSAPTNGGNGESRLVASLPRA